MDNRRKTQWKVLCSKTLQVCSFVFVYISISILCSCVCVGGSGSSSRWNCAIIRTLATDSVLLHWPELREYMDGMETSRMEGLPISLYDLEENDMVSWLLATPTVWSKKSHTISTISAGNLPKEHGKTKHDRRLVVCDWVASFNYVAENPRRCGFQGVCCGFQGVRIPTY